MQRKIQNKARIFPINKNGLLFAHNNDILNIITYDSQRHMLNASSSQRVLHLKTLLNWIVTYRLAGSIQTNINFGY